MYAESILHSGKTSDNSIKVIKEFQDDIKKYSAMAKKYLGSKDKKCDPLAIWPQEVLVDCNQEAERNGYGDDELNFCTCYDSDATKLTRRKKGTSGGDAKNFEKVSFKDGVPKTEKSNLELEIGTCYRFMSINFPTHSISMRSNLEIWSDQGTTKTSVFKVTQGVDQSIDGGISFENMNKPGNYIRHHNVGTYLENEDETPT